MNVAPGATYEAVVDWGVSGATIGMRVVNNAGATTVARVTGFTEYPAGSGIYYRGGNTSPGTAGQYTLVFDDDGGTAAAGHVATEELLVTGNITPTAGTSNLYVTEDEVKNAASLVGESFADSELDIIRPAVCRAIDRYKRTRFYPTTGTRYYTARRGALSLPIADLNALTSLEVDSDGDGDWETEWDINVDFYLEPANATADGVPYNRVCLNDYRSPVFPAYRNAVKITGSWGWAETPAEVKLAAAKLCVRELAILRNAPTGVLVASETAVRIGSVYRDIAYLLDNVNPRPPVASLRVG